MTKRKGGIWRRPGKKLGCNQKTKSTTSATSTSVLLEKSITDLKNKMESRRQRRIVTPIKTTKKENIIQEHLQTINCLEEYNTIILQELNESASHIKLVNLNSKHKKARYEVNTKRLKSSLAMKDNVIIEKNREIDVMKK